MLSIIDFVIKGRCVNRRHISNLYGVDRVGDENSCQIGRHLPFHVDHFFYLPIPLYLGIFRHFLSLISSTRLCHIYQTFNLNLWLVTTSLSYSKTRRENQYYIIMKNILILGLEGVMASNFVVTSSSSFLFATDSL